MTGPEDILLDNWDMLGEIDRNGGVLSEEDVILHRGELIQGVFDGVLGSVALKRDGSAICEVVPPTETTI